MSTPTNPQPPDDQRPAEGTEETQPVGYWERQAAERAQHREQGDPGSTPPYPQGSSGAVFNPTSGQPVAGQESREQPQEPPGRNPDSQMPGVNPYGPYAPGGLEGPGYGNQAANYPPQPGQPTPYQYPRAQGGVPGAYGYPQVAPAHPQSTLALVLGVVGLAGLFVCGLPLLVSPFAWAIGRSSLKEIRESHGRLSGESNALAGMIMGIIGTVLLILVVLGIIALIVLVSVGSTSSGFEGTTV